MKKSFSLGIVVLTFAVISTLSGVTAQPIKQGSKQASSQKLAVAPIRGTGLLIIIGISFGMYKIVSSRKKLN